MASAPAGPPPGSPAPGSQGAPRSPAGSPGLRDVLLIAVAVVVGVLLLEVVTTEVTPLRDALASLPVAVVVLIVGTVGLLALMARRRPSA